MTQLSRADHVGSLLRPEALRKAHHDHGKGAIGDAELAAVTEAAIREAVARQEEAGLSVVTDGEFRRGSWFLGFVQAVDGFGLEKVTFRFHGEGDSQMSWYGPVVKAPVRRRGAIVVDDYRFLSGTTGQTAKVTLPAPSAMHFFGGPNGIDRRIYPELEGFFADLAAIYRAEIEALAAAGCTYLQLDEVPLALLCDPAIRAGLAREGQDPDRLVQLYVDAINDALAGRPEGMTVAMHLCRGNYKGHWMAEGGYDPIAEKLFNEIGVDAFLLEFDTERAGTFEPLRLLPRDKRAFLGVVSTKIGALEDADAMARRLEQAFRHAEPGQLGVCPQCGFASSAGGNPITPDEQWAKLRLVTGLAERLWGKER